MLVFFFLNKKIVYEQDSCWRLKITQLQEFKMRKTNKQKKPQQQKTTISLTLKIYS